MPRWTRRPERAHQRGASLEAGGGRRWWIAIAVSLAAIASLSVFLWQIEVSDGGSGAARSCGSAFDSVVDRSGWEQWWARDLDEPEQSVRSALLRTRLCPGAVNQRLLAAAVLAGIAFSLAASSWMRARSSIGHSRLPDPGPGPTLARLGRLTTAAGAGLTLGGVVAIVVLVADSDSTLFLYTDRLVVGMVGLIVLMPTMAMLVIGRALAIFGSHLERTDSKPHSGMTDAS